jgi:mycofactocin precursor
MTVTTTEDTITEESADREVPADAGATGLVEEDLLVEDVSIDGMCGVY